MTVPSSSSEELLETQIINAVYINILNNLLAERFIHRDIVSLLYVVLLNMNWSAGFFIGTLRNSRKTLIVTPIYSCF